MKFGKKIKHLRQINKLISKDLAKLAKTTQSTISDVENDNRSPQVDTLERICNALGVHISTILSDDDSFSGYYKLSEFEYEIFVLLHQMSEEQQKNLLATLKSFQIIDPRTN